MSTKCFIDNNQFAGLDPEEGCYDNIRHCDLLCLNDDVEMRGQVGAYPVVVSPQSVAGNHPLRGLRSQQPWQKDHEGFTKSDAHYIPAQISSLSDENLESHRLIELEVTICGVNTTWLVDSGSTHSFIN